MKHEFNRKAEWSVVGAATVAAAVVGSIWSGANAASSTIERTDRPFMQNNVEYVCTGVSSESRGDPRWSAYPLKLVFAASDGSYLADVDIQVRDPQGAMILSANCPSPWMLVDLKPGRYDVSAKLVSGPERRTQVIVPGRGRTEYVLHYPGSD